VTARHEDEVRSRFDLLHGRFKRVVPADDVRLRALRDGLEPLRGKRVLDLGCGKGRFAVELAAAGARVVGLDVSGLMLGEAAGLPRVQGTARRLPFATQCFDGVVAVEVFEHLSPAGIDAALFEARRVLRPGGTLAIVDKNAGSLHAERPWLPSLALKWLDERRGLGMYPRGGAARERWFWPGAFRRRLLRWFVAVRVRHLLSPREADRWLFRRCPRFRLLTLWLAQVPGSGFGEGEAPSEPPFRPGSAGGIVARTEPRPPHFFGRRA
jgi:2-polyprenyl-6-hydroxyphenyl methylase/3-demethylubiquinone-9 3-methyltransferase